jgi:dTDP-glucose 4,6-dehydratase
MRRILITGGAGFAGHHLVEHLLERTDWEILVLDSLTYAGRAERLTSIDGYDPERCSIMWHDLRAPLPDSWLLDGVTDVVHLAAESHVDRSITQPVPFVHNNVMATLNLVEWARTRDLYHFIQISTDEVYGPAVFGQNHKEWSTILPSNPYSASKAAQEAIAFSYWRTYGLPLTITNTMNLYGERQDPEKFVAKMVKAIKANQVVILHARPGTDGAWTPSSRHWLHARNHADAILWVLNGDVTLYKEGALPDRWNVAGEEATVLEMAQLIAEHLGAKLDFRFEDYHSSRPGHDLRYALDSSKIRTAGWSPPLSLDDALGRTVNWMLKHEEWLR